MCVGGGGGGEACALVIDKGQTGKCPPLWQVVGPIHCLITSHFVTKGLSHYSSLSGNFGVYTMVVGVKESIKTS